MTNQELIETAKQAMKDLSGDKMMEHEQSAYNCLRLFCKRFEKIERIAETVESMKVEADHNMMMYQESDACDWGHQEGVLITNQAAIDIYNSCFA